MLAKNQLGCQHPGLVFDRLKSFQRGERLERSPMTMRVVRRENVDNTEVIRKEEEAMRSRVPSLRISNGRHGDELRHALRGEVLKN